MSARPGVCSGRWFRGCDFGDVIVGCSGHSNSCPLPGPNFTHSWSQPRSTTTQLFLPQMSPSSQTANPSISNFTAIFDAASHEYKAHTKQDLATHPFAAALQGHNSPDYILNVFRDQARAFNKFRKGNDKLMEWLTPIVNILLTFSETLGDGAGLVSHLPFYISRYFTVVSVGIFACEDDFHRHRYPPRGSSPPMFPLVCVCVTLGSGGERCYGELWSTPQPLRAHSIIPPTSQSLHSSSSHTRDYLVTREDHGADSRCSGVFDEGDEGEANQYVFPYDVLVRG